MIETIFDTLNSKAALFAVQTVFEEKNIFTATEIVFLLPTYAYASYSAFLEANRWAQAYYPNKRPLPAQQVFEAEKGRVKVWSEALLSGRFGDMLENACLRLTRFYRRRKFSKMAESDFQHAMRATPGVAKHHPNSFQQRVLRAYEQKLEALQQQVTFPVS